MLQYFYIWFSLG